MSIIRVLKHYVGVDSHNNMIYPGDYTVGDPLLYGLESDLIDIRYAVMVEPLPAAEDDTAPAGASLEDMTVAQLKTLADGLGVDLGGARSKADIIARLREAGVELPEPPDEGFSWRPA